MTGFNSEIAIAASVEALIGRNEGIGRTIGNSPRRLTHGYVAEFFQWQWSCPYY
jgi:hypothetical protein